KTFTRHEFWKELTPRGRPSRYRDPKNDPQLRAALYPWSLPLSARTYLNPYIEGSGVFPGELASRPLSGLQRGCRNIRCRDRSAPGTSTGPACTSASLSQTFRPRLPVETAGLGPSG